VRQKVEAFTIEFFVFYVLLIAMRTAASVVNVVAVPDFRSPELRRALQALDLRVPTFPNFADLGDLGILAISFVALCSTSQPKGCHLFAVVPANKGFKLNRPLRHAGFSTGSCRVFHWITQGFSCM